MFIKELNSKFVSLVTIESIGMHSFKNRVRVDLVDVSTIHSDVNPRWIFNVEVLEVFREGGFYERFLIRKVRVSLGI